MTFKKSVYQSLEEFMNIFKLISEISIFSCFIYIKYSLKIVYIGRVTLAFPIGAERAVQ